MKKINFEFVTKTATEVGRSWSNKQVAQFHYFNPNGLFAEKMAINEEISRAVNAGSLPAGYVIAYGTMNSYNTDRLAHHAMLRLVNGTALRVTLSMLRADINRAREALAKAQA